MISREVLPAIACACAPYCGMPMPWPNPPPFTAKASGIPDVGLGVAVGGALVVALADGLLEPLADGLLEPVPVADSLGLGPGEGATAAANGCTTSAGTAVLGPKRTASVTPAEAIQASTPVDTEDPTTSTGCASTAARVA